MKKFVLVLVFALFSITAINAEETNTTPPQYPQCTTVENVSFTLDSQHSSNGICTVSVKNYNNFKVSVYYTVKAYDSNGNERTVYSGSMVLKSYEDTKNHGYMGSDRFHVDSSLTSFHLVDCRATACEY